MAVLDIDNYRTANLLIKLHGPNAELEAAVMFDEMTARGDLDGRRGWHRVSAAIKELQGRKPLKADAHAH